MRPAAKLSSGSVAVIVKPARDRRQHHPAIPGLPREVDAFLDKAPPDAEAARLRLQIEQPQPGHLVGLPDDHDRADHRALTLGDPASFAHRIRIAEEASGGFGDDPFEHTVRPAVFGRVERRVAMDDPAKIARPRRPQDGGDRRLRSRIAIEQFFGTVECGDKTRLGAFRQRCEQCGDLIARAPVDRVE
jgi:hypothetical protein